MGGNLLKHCTRRHSAAEYNEKVAEILFIFRKHLPYSAKFAAIPSYRSKESFGDADILYYRAADKPFNAEYIKYLFNPSEIHMNGGVATFDYKELQVDLIFTESRKFNYALSYYSYNDMGNFLGKLARHFGLSHGHKGLYLPIRDDNENLVESILVTEDHNKFLYFVGLDRDVFHDGFDTMEDVYRYVQSSPYFNIDSYKLENISHIGRVRDRKRESYRNFLKFNESYTGTSCPKVENKSIFLPKIFSAFVGVRSEFQQVMKDLVYIRESKKKFNGDLVSLLTGLTGKPLGIFMSHLKSLPMFSSEILIYLQQSDITDMIVKEYDGYKV